MSSVYLQYSGGTATLFSWKASSISLPHNMHVCSGAILQVNLQLGMILLSLTNT